MLPGGLQWVRSQLPNAELYASRVSHVSLIWKIVKTLHAAKFFCSPKGLGHSSVHIFSDFSFVLTASFSPGEFPSQPCQSQVFPRVWQVPTYQWVACSIKAAGRSHGVAHWQEDSESRRKCLNTSLVLPQVYYFSFFLYLTDFQTTECLHIFHFKVQKTSQNHLEWLCK